MIRAKRYRRSLRYAKCKSDRRAAPIFFGPCTPWRTWGTRPISSGVCYDGRNLTDAGASCGEEIAQAPGLISLRLDETILSLEMVRVFECGGKSLILASIIFQDESFCLKGAIEAWADFVGFGIVDQSLVLFCFWGVAY